MKFVRLVFVDFRLFFGVGEYVSEVGFVAGVLERLEFFVVVGAARVALVVREVDVVVGYVVVAVDGVDEGVVCVDREGEREFERGREGEEEREGVSLSVKKGGANGWRNCFSRGGRSCFGGGCFIFKFVWRFMYFLMRETTSVFSRTTFCRKYLCISFRKF